MTVYDFIKTYVRTEEEIHLLDKNDISIGMIPSSKMVDEWEENPVICEDTWKAKPMPESVASKIRESEFISIYADGSFPSLYIQTDIDANDLRGLKS